MPHLALAFLAALVAASLYAASIALQALEARRAPAALQLRPSLIGFLSRRPRWLLGTTLGLFGWAFQALALAHGPLALVQPTLALSVVGLLLVSRRVLGEQVRPRSVSAAAGIVFGVFLLAIGVPSSGAAREVHGTGLLLAALAAVSLAPFVARRASARSARILSVAAGTAYVLLALATTLLDGAVGRNAWWAAAFWAGVCGAAAGTAGLAEMSALQLASATVVAPIVFALETVAPALLAPLIGQRIGGSPIVLAIDLLGLSLVAGGVTLLARSPSISDFVDARG